MQHNQSCHYSCKELCRHAASAASACVDPGAGAVTGRGMASAAMTAATSRAVVQHQWRERKDPICCCLGGHIRCGCVFGSLCQAGAGQAGLYRRQVWVIINPHAATLADADVLSRGDHALMRARKAGLCPHSIQDGSFCQSAGVPVVTQGWALHPVGRDRVLAHDQDPRASTCIQRTKIKWHLVSYKLFCT